MKKRKYQQTARAKQQALTRQRIVEAAVELHEALGPAHTTIKAVAEQAGVQRLTVYRHFPDDFDLFQACTQHWLKQNPPPSKELWQDLAHGEQRSQKALLAFYRYYRGTEKMWRATYRDRHEVEALRAPLHRFESYLYEVGDDLLPDWRPAKAHKQLISLTLRHCLHFLTWDSLQQQVSDGQMAELAGKWLAGVSSA